MKVQFNYRSGRPMTVVCDSCTVEHSSQTGEITSWRIQGAVTPRPIAMSISEIESVWRVDGATAKGRETLAAARRKAAPTRDQGAYRRVLDAIAVALSDLDLSGLTDDEARGALADVDLVELWERVTGDE